MVRGILLFTLLFGSSALPLHAQFTTPVPISGYAWSSNIGWVSFSGPGYGVEIETDGDIVGHAWSSNIGWIQFGGLGANPYDGSASDAAVTFSTETVTGWARACVAAANNDCTGGTHVDAGGWDGWISLNCSNTGACATASYSVQTNSGLHGYAWGSDVVGWLRFSGGGYGGTFSPPCTTIPYCTTDLTGYETTNQWCQVVSSGSCTPDICNSGSPGSCVTDNPSGTLDLVPGSVRAGATVTLNWSSPDATSCTVEQQNAAGDASGTWIGTTGSDVTSQPINRFTVFSLQCTQSGDPALETEIASNSIQIIPTQIEF